MNEIVAWGGFQQDRIMVYADLNGAMLEQYGMRANSPLFSEVFWAGW